MGYFITIFPGLVTAQGTGRAIINVDFGEGKANPGPPLPVINTSFSYSADSCAAPGSYTVTNNLYRCPANRMGRSIDNTPGSNYGYMMLVSDTQSLSSKIVYIDTLKEALCGGTQYEFSAWLLNTSIPGYCNRPVFHSPRFTFKIETASGQLLQSSNTGPMPFDYNPGFTPKFHFFKVDFFPPPGVNDFVVKIEDDATGYLDCGYSFAIDDIRFTALGPQSDIGFDGAIGNETVSTICYQDNKTISMTGSVGAFYSNTAMQWQQSSDNGISWTDIPGATSPGYSRAFSIPGTFLFRLSAGESNNIANPNCRVVSNLLRVQVEGIPNDFTITSNSPVCAGSELQFNATGGASYEWTGPNGFYDNVYYAHIYHASLSDSGIYYVDIVSLGGCRARDSTHVTILGPIDVNAWPDTAICKGRSVQLHASAGMSYSWFPATGLSNSSVINPIAKPVVTTNYTVTVADTNGCSDTAQVQIKVLNESEIKAAISGTGILCRPYDSASFINASTGNITRWHWDFGNRQTDATNQPPEQYYSIRDNQDILIVSLSVTDSAGCADTAYHKIRVVNNCYIAVPTAFTPNGDGLNDYLYPLNAYKATSLLFKVYNRSGELVYETRDWTKKWDGTLKGRPQASGVYVWMLEYKDPSNKKISLKGTALLIR